MLEPILTNKFKQELELLKRRQWGMLKLKEVMRIIQNEQPLPEHCRPHSLQGKWKGCIDCHVQSDWVLIYKIDLDAKTVTSHRTGAHSDLFKK